MNFDLSEEQGLLRDSIDKLVANEYSFENRERYRGEPDGWSREFWSMLAENGFLALPYPEAQGGMGFGAVENMLVMEALGRALTLEPYLETVVTCGSILRHGASRRQADELLPLLHEGNLVLALAQTERQSRYHLNDVATAAREDGEDFLLDGTKVVVFHGDSADKLIVSARTGGKRSDASGISLFLVDADADGIRRRAYATQDGLRAADITLDGVRVARDAMIGDRHAGLPLLEAAADETISALAAESAGCAQAALDLTVEYLKQRKQFGAAIGSFQALQHRAAEMLVEVEQTRSLAMYAALIQADKDLAKRRKALSQIKLQVARSALFVAEAAVQLHGGIGVTGEYAVGHYLKRIRMMEGRFGDRDFHLDRLVEQAMQGDGA